MVTNSDLPKYCVDGVQLVTVAVTWKSFRRENASYLQAFTENTKSERPAFED